MPKLPLPKAKKTGVFQHSTPNATTLNALPERKVQYTVEMPEAVSTPLLRILALLWQEHSPQNSDRQV